MRLIFTCICLLFLGVSPFIFMEKWREFRILESGAIVTGRLVDKKSIFVGKNGSLIYLVEGTRVSHKVPNRNLSEYSIGDTALFVKSRRMPYSYVFKYSDDRYYVELVILVILDLCSILLIIRLWFAKRGQGIN